VGGYRAERLSFTVTVGPENNFFYFYISPNLSCHTKMFCVCLLPQRLTWCARSDREETEGVVG
jgi:hypothetical protein